MRAIPSNSCGHSRDCDLRRDARAASVTGCCQRVVVGVRRAGDDAEMTLSTLALAVGMIVLVGGSIAVERFATSGPARCDRDLGPAPNGRVPGRIVDPDPRAFADRVAADDASPGDPGEACDCACACDDGATALEGDSADDVAGYLERAIEEDRQRQREAELVEWRSRNVGRIGSVRGVALDANGEPMPGATLVAVTSERTATAIADEHGRFELVDLVAGPCELTAYYGEVAIAQHVQVAATMPTAALVMFPSAQDAIGISFSGVTSIENHYVID